MWARLLLITLLLGNAATAFADPAEDDMPSELRFAVIADVPSTTLALELLRTAYDQLGINVVTRLVPSRRALLMADIGEVDGDLFRIADVGDQYPNLVRVPYPLLEGRLHAVTNNPGLVGLQSLGQLTTTDLRVAVRRGVIVAEQTAEALGMTPVRTDSYAQILAMLEWGRVDLALVSGIEGFSPLNDNAWDSVYVFPEAVTDFTLYHYLHRRHAGLAAPLARVLEQLEQNGEKARILERLSVGTGAGERVPDNPE
ncbi:transporter substrate-binding domain-containing protein [Marinobacter sp. OP 3.4]|uniref:transporter substrate-binding domain-containing protein n=1 Tax=Marinobacter sp. OP 3.4 TaxID=3076501 RepID=UPI002E2367E1